MYSHSVEGLLVSAVKTLAHAGSKEPLVSLWGMTITECCSVHTIKPIQCMNTPDKQWQ